MLHICTENIQKKISCHSDDFLDNAENGSEYNRDTRLGLSITMLQLPCSHTYRNMCTILCLFAAEIQLPLFLSSSL